MRRRWRDRNRRLDRGRYALGLVILYLGIAATQRGRILVIIAALVAGAYLFEALDEVSRLRRRWRVRRGKRA